MKAAVLSVCKAFLQKCPAEKRGKLFQSLSQEDQQILHELPTAFYRDPAEGFEEASANLPEIHYSWLTPLFRTFAENEVRLFLSCLTEKQAKGLKKQLLFTNHGVEVKVVARPFLQNTLWEKVADKEILPLACLPESPLNPLLEIEAGSLLNLIDFLGMHDLATQVKQTIDTARLKQIYAALSKDELAFVKTLLLSKEPLTFKIMELQKWDGKEESLRALIHQRGLNRLAKALYTPDGSLAWHISHRLDIERGELLLKLSTPLEHARGIEILTDQITEILPRIDS